MSSVWSKLVVSLSLALGIAAYPQFIGLEFNDALTLNYKNGELRPVVYYLSIRNTGTQEANFYLKTDVNWMFIFREGNNNISRARILEGGAVNFILEIHPELVSDGTHEANIVITADHLIEPITFSTKEIKLTFNKNVEVASSSVSPTSLVPIESGVTSTPMTVPTIIKQALTAIPKPIIYSSMPSPSPFPSPSMAKIPPKLVEVKTGGQDRKNFWQILKNIFGRVF